MQHFLNSNYCGVNGIMNNYLKQKSSIYVATKDSLVEFTKVAQKKKVRNSQNGEKQPALKDTSSKSNKHEHLLTQQKMLKSINN